MITWDSTKSQNKTRKRFKRMLISVIIRQSKNMHNSYIMIRKNLFKATTNNNRNNRAQHLRHLSYLSYQLTYNILRFMDAENLDDRVRVKQLFPVFCHLRSEYAGKEISNQSDEPAMNQLSFCLMVPNTTPSCPHPKKTTAERETECVNLVCVF